MKAGLGRDERKAAKGLNEFKPEDLSDAGI